MTTHFGGGQTDKAEAALLAEEHSAQLAAAAAALWQQSDRVKALAGRALLGDVVAERDRQVVAAAEAAQVVRQHDAAFLVDQRCRLEVCPGCWQGCSMNALPSKGVCGCARFMSRQGKTTHKALLSACIHIMPEHRRQLLWSSAR